MSILMQNRDLGFILNTMFKSIEIFYTKTLIFGKKINLR